MNSANVLLVILSVGWVFDLHNGDIDRFKVNFWRRQNVLRIFFIFYNFAEAPSLLGFNSDGEFSKMLRLRLPNMIFTECAPVP